MLFKIAIYFTHPSTLLLISPRPVISGDKTLYNTYTNLRRFGNITYYYKYKVENELSKVIMFLRKSSTSCSDQIVRTVQNVLITMITYELTSGHIRRSSHCRAPVIHKLLRQNDRFVTVRTHRGGMRGPILRLRASPRTSLRLPQLPHAFKSLLERKHVRHRTILGRLIQRIEGVG